MPRVKVNDINIYYEVHGDGYPLIMIMGLSANLDWWDPPLMEAMSSKFKTFIFDNRGAGRTDKPEIDYSVKMFADDTAGLMDALNIQRAHVLGISMGGMIAQEFVLKYPEKVEKLVLCATNCGYSKSVPPSSEVLELMARDFEGMEPEEVIKDMISLLFTEDFIKNNPNTIELFRESALKAPIPASAYKRQLDAILKYDTCRRIKKMNTPTLIMHGKKDILVPPQNGEVLAKRIPRAKLSLFDNSGHALFSHETEKVIKTLLEFLT